jgi:hypothetical protein
MAFFIIHLEIDMTTDVKQEAEVSEPLTISAVFLLTLFANYLTVLNKQVEAWAPTSTLYEWVTQILVLLAGVGAIIGAIGFAIGLVCLLWMLLKYWAHSDHGIFWGTVRFFGYCCVVFALLVYFVNAGKKR